MVLIVSIIIALLYVALISAFSIAWRREPVYEPSKICENKKVSIIVAFRNEEANLKALLQSIRSQTYKNVEVVLVNDHSEDSSCKIISDILTDEVHLLNLPLDKSGKKAALRYGTENSSGQILFFTDADCILSDKCIENAVRALIDKDCAMACGPVQFSGDGSIFSRLVQLEFLSLTGSGAAGFFLNQPFMCNGANYAINRETYFEAYGSLHDDISSGDDVFLLHYVLKYYDVCFVQNPQSIVRTPAPADLSVFLAQRIRWASKASSYKNPFAIFVSAITLLMSAIIFFCFVLGFFATDYFLIMFLLLLIKSVCDTVFIVPVLQFYQTKNLLPVIPLLTILYPIYVVVVGVASLFYKPEWKGRKIR